MRIIVQKFGGTSLATLQSRNFVLKQIQTALADEVKLVVVVSAIGRKGDPYATDTLLDWIRQNGDALPLRELDMLLSCGELISAATLSSIIHAAGICNSVLTGSQAGIVTSDRHGDARILSIDPAPIINRLNEQSLVIVAGFQGVSRAGEITTLGRGGSDTSATALAASLGAERVDIFTDVDGVLTADPSIVDNARPLGQMTYAEICNMAQQGAKVIHPRAVEIAMQANIPIRIRSTFSDGPGTLVTNSQGNWKQSEHFSDRIVTGIAQVPHISQIQITSNKGQYDLQLRVFKAMAKQQISIDFINVNPSGVTYTVFDHEADRANEILRSLGYQPEIKRSCAKVAVIGGGINGVPGIMAQIVESLTAQNIRLLQSADSNTTIWILVEGADMVNAVRALHQKFLINE